MRINRANRNSGSQGDGGRFDALTANAIEGAVPLPPDPRETHSSDTDWRRLAAVVVLDAQEELKTLRPVQRNAANSAWRFFFLQGDDSGRIGSSTLPLWCYLMEIDPDMVRKRALGDCRTKPRRRRRI